MFNEKAEDTMALDGSNGSAVLQSVYAFKDNLIDMYTTLLHCHATDFCLDGKSKHNNRALVDGGNQLIINDKNDYGNGVVINGLQNPIGRFGQSGNWHRQVGMMCGYLGANSGSDSPVTGNASLKFSDLSFYGGSADFDPGRSGMSGYKGKFLDTPLVVFVPNQFNLTTGEVFTSGWYTAYTDHIDFNWEYNAGGTNGYQAWQVFVIGPIEPEY